MKTKYSLLTVFFSFILLLSGMAADNNNKRQERLERILQKRTDFVISRIDLTPIEKEKFIPLYREYLGKKMTFINRRNRNVTPLSENEYRLKNETFINNQFNKASLDRIYYEKFREILPESKIYLLFQAEEAYKNELLKQIENRGKKQTQ
jgi:hypothetical protein